MAKIFLDDQTAGRTYVARFTQDSDGETWNGSDFVAASSLTTAALQDAINAVTLDAVTNDDDVHIGYSLTVPAGITTACHVSLYLTSYTAGDAEDYGADYNPTIADKTGFKLAADGLDQISATPVANPTTWAQRLNWVMQRFFYSAKTPDALVVKDANGDTLTTQALTDDTEGTETMGLPS